MDSPLGPHVQSGKRSCPRSTQPRVSQPQSAPHRTVWEGHPIGRRPCPLRTVGPRPPGHPTDTALASLERRPGPCHCVNMMQACLVLHSCGFLSSPAVATRPLPSRRPSREGEGGTRAGDRASLRCLPSRPGKLAEGKQQRVIPLSLSPHQPQRKWAPSSFFCKSKHTL